ncbi:hypothetical protein, partial [Nonomuraea turkmeniaca]|uniref:hypothetical protein n=1 Tax=Nonomuraea turkmeniaca TaxID=103838 RepID=UPI001B85FB01
MADSIAILALSRSPPKDCAGAPDRVLPDRLPVAEGEPQPRSHPAIVSVEPRGGDPSEHSLVVFGQRHVGVLVHVPRGDLGG